MCYFSGGQIGCLGDFYVRNGALILEASFSGPTFSTDGESCLQFEYYFMPGRPVSHGGREYKATIYLQRKTRSWDAIDTIIGNNEMFDYFTPSFKYIMHQYNFDGNKYQRYRLKVDGIAFFDDFRVLNTKCPPSRKFLYHSSIFLWFQSRR